MDECTGECLAIDVGRSLTSEHVLARLAMLFVYRGVPEHIRSDIGSEFTANAVREWLAKIGVNPRRNWPMSLAAGRSFSVRS